MSTAVSYTVLSAGCCVGIAALIYGFGRGPDRVVNSREQPGVFGAIMALLVLGLVFAVAGLASL